MANSWFPHDATAHNDQRILALRMKYGWEGYGLYWALLEAMYETADAKLDANALRPLCLRFAITEDRLMEIIDHCISISLFVREDGYVFSVRLVEEKLAAIERSTMARQSAARRWTKGKRKPNNANALPTQCEGNAPPHPTPHIQQSSMEKEKCDDDPQTTERKFREIALAEQWCDVHYLDKTFHQAGSLSIENRQEFYRKVRVLVNAYHSKSQSARKLAHKMYGEIAGFVNDRGAMEGRLTPQEIEARRLFREEGVEVDCA
ncbi:MAG: DUF4373 domain-containing protein [Pirellulaceae bacterium]